MTDEMTFDFAQMNAPRSLSARATGAAMDVVCGMGLALEKLLIVVGVLVVVGAFGAFAVEQAALDLGRTAELRGLMASLVELLQPIFTFLG